MPLKQKFDLDGEVQKKVNALVDGMRAKRLAGELPAPEPKVNDEQEKEGDADEDQEALEAMLDPDEE